MAGDPFEPELAAAAAAACPRRRRWRRSTSCCGSTSFARPTCRGASASGIRSCAARSTRPRPAGWRLGAHERCAEALAARGATASARAHHVERSAREGDVAAVAVLREAGEEAVRLAPGERRALVRRGAAPARRRPRRRRSASSFSLARARALTAAGHFADSHSALLDALAIVPADSHALRAQARPRLCRGRERSSAGTSRRTAASRAPSRSLPDQDSPEAVALMIELAVNAFWRARYEAMHEAAERAVDAARRLGDAPLTAAALAVLALADSMMGAAERAESSRAEAAALVDSLSDDELARHLEAATWLAGVELYLDRYAEGEAHADRALAVARATGQGELFLLLVATLGGLWRQRGKLAEAAELLDGGIEAARLLGQHARAGLDAFSAARPRRSRTGDVELALATAQESFDLSQDAGEQLPLGRGGRRPRRRAARDRAAGAARSSCSSAPRAARSSC